MSKVHIRHFRNLKYDFNNCETPFTAEFVIDNLGGITMASEQIGENTFEVGFAICNRDENFCKKVGRRIAIRRLNHYSIIVNREQMEELKESATAYDFYTVAEPLLKEKGLTAKKAFI